MPHPIQGVLVTNLVPSTHRGECMPERMQLELLPAWEAASLAELLHDAQQVSVIDRVMAFGIASRWGPQEHTFVNLGQCIQHLAKPGMNGDQA